RSADELVISAGAAGCVGSRPDELLHVEDEQLQLCWVVQCIADLAASKVIGSDQERLILGPRHEFRAAGGEVGDGLVIDGLARGDEQDVAHTLLGKVFDQPRSQVSLTDACSEVADDFTTGAVFDFFRNAGESGRVWQPQVESGTNLVDQGFVVGEPRGHQRVTLPKAGNSCDGIRTMRDPRLISVKVVAASSVW